VALIQQNLSGLKTYNLARQAVMKQTKVSGAYSPNAAVVNSLTPSQKRKAKENSRERRKRGISTTTCCQQELLSMGNKSR
jgi:hypothetical protein